MINPVAKTNAPLASIAIVLIMMVSVHTVLAGGDPDEFPDTADQALTDTNIDDSLDQQVQQSVPTEATDLAEPASDTIDSIESKSSDGSVAATSTPVNASAAASAVTAASTTTTPVAAAATEEQTNTLFSRIVDAMRPESGVPPLDNDRLTFYLSDRVLFAQFERSGARYDIESSRVHLGFMVTEDRDTLFQAGISADASFTSSLRLSFGARTYIALLGDENNDAFAGALGLEAAYQLPFERAPLEFNASLYYAPDVLTFGQGDRVVDLQLGVSVPFRSQLSIFGGIRFLQIDTRTGDEEIDNRIHIGFRWDFI